MIYDLPTIPAILLGLFVLVLGSARLTRLLIFDVYPPAAWLRIKWDDATHKSDWNNLMHCAYCLAPWIVLANGLLGWLAYETGWITVWSVFNLWLGAAYLAAMTVAYDGDD